MGSVCLLGLFLPTDGIAAIILFFKYCMSDFLTYKHKAFSRSNRIAFETYTHTKMIPWTRHPDS